LFLEFKTGVIEPERGFFTDWRYPFLPDCCVIEDRTQPLAGKRLAGENAPEPGAHLVLRADTLKVPE
jgi:hypothetical protein